MRSLRDDQIKLTTDKLELAIKSVIQELQKNKFLPELSPGELDQIINNIIQNFHDKKIELTIADLKNSQVLNAFDLSVISEFIKLKKPELDFDYTILFDKNLDNIPEIKNKLKNVIGVLLTELNELNPEDKRELTPDEVKRLAEFMANDLVDNMINQKEHQLAENAAINKTLSALLISVLYSRENSPLALTLKNLHGGIDPRFTGSYLKPVLYAVGNLIGVVDLNGINYQSGSFIDALNREPGFGGVADYLGIENSIRNRLTGITDVLQEELAHIGVYSVAPRAKL